MPTFKMILKSKETDQSAVTALLQLAFERFEAMSFERLDTTEEPVAQPAAKPNRPKGKLGQKRKPHGRTSTMPRFGIAGTNAAAEFQKMAQASPADRVSLSAYRERLIKLGYADTTAQVTLNKLARCDFIKLEGGYGYLLKHFEPHGIDALLRRMIDAKIAESHQRATA